MERRTRIASASVFLGLSLHFIRGSSEVSGSTSSKSEEVSEYCQWEYFNASCSGADDVILMRSAFYGRMRFGRCVRENHGAVGCGADVLPYLDRKCSGRKTCQLTIPDATLHNIHPCPKELMPYLEASYSCIRVKSMSNQICKQSGIEATPESETLSETPESGILLSSAITELQSYGHVACPWIVRTKPGRRINLTLFSFSSSTSENGGDIPTACSLKILIVDKNKTTAAELCADGQRQKQIYASRGNQLRVFIQPGKASEGRDSALLSGRFLLSYQAFDCADITGLSNAWVRRSDDKVVVRCNFTAETFFLTCRNSRWIGELYNCSDGGHMAGYHGSSLHTYGILAVIGLGVSLGVATAVVLLFSLVVCLKKRRRSKQGPAVLAPTSYPLLSGAGGGAGSSNNDPIEVQSIYLSDCRAALRQPDHVCSVDFCTHKQPYWGESIYREPSNHRHHNNTTGLPSTATQSTATSPVSIGRGGCRSPVPRHLHHHNHHHHSPDAQSGGRPHLDGTASSGSLMALLAETCRSSSTHGGEGTEGRYSDPDSQSPMIERGAATEARTFDLLKDFARSFAGADEEGQTIHRTTTRDSKPATVRAYDGHSEMCPCPRRVHDINGSVPRGPLARVRLSSSDAMSSALSVT